MTSVLDTWPTMPVAGKGPPSAKGWRDPEFAPPAWGDGDNTALITGERLGAFVVDIDDEDALEGLPPFPDTVAVRTAHGRHLYLRPPIGCPMPGNGDSGFPDGVNIRGEGGYVVLPPSIHPETGEPYTWITHPDEEEIAEAPAWVMQRLAARPTPRGETDADPAKLAGRGEKPESWGRSALNQELEKLAATSEGSRNNALQKAAFRMGQVCMESQLPWNDARDSLQVVALDTWATDTPEKDLECIERNMSDGAAQPRYPERVGAAPALEPASPPPDDQPAAAPPPDGQPFRALGYNSSTYYYLPRRVGQRVSINAGSHGSWATLFQLAPASWWHEQFETAAGAAGFAMERCQEAGVYDPDRERGTGVWQDGGRVVVHTGRYLEVDGDRVDPPAFESEWFYPRATAIPGPARGGVTPEEVERIVRAAELMRWQSERSAALLLGWIVLSPVCGVLPWRPHVWLTGDSGSGKSHAISHFVRPLLGGMDLNLLGRATEPSIRRMLGSRALPVVVDEAEGDRNPRRQAHREALLELIRASSADTGAAITVAAPSGHGVLTFRPRSMFMLGSVGVDRSKAADASRLTLLELRGVHQGGPDHWEELQRLRGDMTEDLGRRLIGQTVSRLNVLAETREVFAGIAADNLGGQRVGDQVGTLLAGRWLLEHDRPASDSEAADVFASFDWSEETAGQTSTDYESVLRAIMQHRTRWEYPDGGRTASVGEVVEQLRHAPIEQAGLAGQLSTFGIRIESGEAWIANQSELIRDALRNTEYSSGWREMLSRIPGARRSSNGELPASARFGTGHVSRFVAVPLGDGA